MAKLLSSRYVVATAADGEEALRRVRELEPDLVLSDVMMPKVDGMSLLRALREEPATRLLPVILLSARVGEHAAVAGLEAGADDYLMKPFAARELLARVRVHLELARTRRAWAVELQRANHELEAFSYSVSHDLRAPLRAIEGFSKALLREYESALDEKGRHYLERVRAGTLRMARLIDDLLEFSRTTRSPLVTGPVNLSAIAADVVAELRRREPGRNVEVHVEPGLAVLGDRRLLGIALENLIGNAWKFTSKKAEPRIEVGRERVDGEDTFFVRDNGAGFDMTFAKKLFLPFNRLHADSDFEGTGIGLATVQRIVARHGGRIWGEGKPLEGATFHFTLGREEP